jgi:hypothetical protein
MQLSKTLSVNRTDKQKLAHKQLLLSIIVSTPYIIFTNILFIPSHAKEIKFYDETGKYQAPNTSNDDTDPDAKNSGECDRIAIDSGKCDAFTPVILSLESIKCS